MNPGSRKLTSLWINAPPGSALWGRLNSVWRGQAYCRGYYINVQHCSASTPPGGRRVLSFISSQGELQEPCNQGPGLGAERISAGSYPLRHTLTPSHLLPIPIPHCSVPEARVAKQPWKSLLIAFFIILTRLGALCLGWKSPRKTQAYSLWWKCSSGRRKRQPGL